MPRTANTQPRNTKLPRLVPALLSWFAENARDLPWRRTRDPYAIWVSEIMLQQTQVKTVIPYWERWMRELPTIASLAEASADKIHKLWEGLGYYTRVRNMQKAAQEIVAKGKVGSCQGPHPNPPQEPISQTNDCQGNKIHSIDKHSSDKILGTGVQYANSISGNSQPEIPRGAGVSPVRTEAHGQDARATKPRPPHEPGGRSVSRVRTESHGQDARATISRPPAYFGSSPPRRRRSQVESTICEFPKTFEEVLALPGIGRYTAGAICSIAFNQSTPILDGNVMRVLTRVFGIAENPRDKKANEHLWNLAQDLVICAANGNQKSKIGNRQFPACSHLNQSLMELGALVCTPREPKCSLCPISKHCFAFQKNQVADFPNLEKRPAATARRFAAFVVENRGKFLVQQRPEGVVNAHLWEFPNIELNGTPSDAAAAAQAIFGFVPKELKPLCTIKHTITRYRITVEAFRIEGAQRKPASLSRWLSFLELQKLSFPSAHKKILSVIAAGGDN